MSARPTPVSAADRRQREVEHGDAWFTVDQPSKQFASFDIPAIAEVGIELDHKLAALLDALAVAVPLELRA